MLDQGSACPAASDDVAPDFVVVDVETSCSRVSSICQIGIVGFRDGREVFAWETLVDPCDDFYGVNTRIHGIAAAHVVGQPDYGDIHPTVERLLAGRTTVAHSMFDKGALAAACRIHHRVPIETRWLDSVRVAKRAWPELASHRLNVLSRFLGLDHRHHDALSDARAAGLVVVRAIDHTGIPLEKWLSPPPRQRPGPAPKPATHGPFVGERVALLGAARDGALARAVAALGGRVVTSVGLTTTMLVVADGDPIAPEIRATSAFRRALEFEAAGRPIRILSEETLMGSFGRAQHSA